MRGKIIYYVQIQNMFTIQLNVTVIQVHFQPEMWEQRSDKKRKLKHNAVPTMFKYFSKKQIPVTIPNTIEETQQPVYEEHIIVNEKQVKQKCENIYILLKESIFEDCIILLQTVINDTVEPAPAPTTSLLNDTEHIEVNEKQVKQK